MRNDQANFLHQRLKVFLRTLLAMEADLIMQWVVSVTEPDGGAEVGLGLLHPLPRQLFHTAPFPWTRPRAGTSRLPPGAISCFSVSGRLCPAGRAGRWSG